MKKLQSTILWRRGTDGRGGRPTVWSVTIIWLVLSTTIIYATNSGLESPGQTTFRGEVYGDLSTTGRVTSRDVSANSSIYLSNEEYPGSPGRTGHLHLRVSNVTDFTTFTQEDWDAPRYCQTHKSISGQIEIEIGTGGVYGYGLGTDITYNISEFHGTAEGSVLGQVSDYQTVQSISGVSGTARIPPGGELGFTDARLTFDGTVVHIDSGGIIPSGDGWADLSMDGYGRLDGGWSSEGQVMYDVQVDGKVRIWNLDEKVGDGHSLRELVTVRGEDIVIVTLAQPSTNSHWGTWLEPPWTIEVSTDDPGGVRMSKPVTASVEAIVIWIVTVLVIYVGWSVRRSRDARGDGHPAIPAREGGASQVPSMTGPPGPSRARGRSGSAVTGGVICILNSIACFALVMLYTRSGSVIDGLCIVVGVINPLIGLIGGTFAVLKQNYRLAMLGAVFTMASPGVIVAGPVCIPIPWAGVLALVLIFAGRKAFRSGTNPANALESIHGIDGPWR